MNRPQIRSPWRWNIAWIFTAVVAARAVVAAETLKPASSSSRMRGVLIQPAQGSDAVVLLLDESVSASKRQESARRTAKAGLSCFPGPCWKDHGAQVLQTESTVGDGYVVALARIDLSSEPSLMTVPSPRTGGSERPHAAH